MRYIKTVIAMIKLKLPLATLLATALVVSCDNAKQGSKPEYAGDKIVRIAEIEVDSTYLDEYKSILKEESEASVRLEPGVICIFPTLQKDHPTQVSILEIYANKEAYQAHLKTPHFLKYKTTTQNMVKSLRLIDMEALDSTTMAFIFSKLKQ
jgi:quinol monooxygenase YgiN